jgi:hypothetical protein
MKRPLDKEVTKNIFNIIELIKASYNVSKVNHKPSTTGSSEIFDLFLRNGMLSISVSHCHSYHTNNLNGLDYYANMAFLDVKQSFVKEVIGISMSELNLHIKRLRDSEGNDVANAYYKKYQSTVQRFFNAKNIYFNILANGKGSFVVDLSQMEENTLENLSTLLSKAYYIEQTSDVSLVNLDMSCYQVL